MWYQICNESTALIFHKKKDYSDKYSDFSVQKLKPTHGHNPLFKYFTVAQTIILKQNGVISNVLSDKHK